MSQDQTAQDYQKLHHKVFFITLIFDAALLTIFFLSGLSVSLKNLVTSFTSNPSLINAVYFFIFSLGFYLIHFPIHVFEGFIWEHRFKLSNQSFAQWIVDELKQNVLGFIIALILIEAVYIFLSKFYDTWWIYASVFWLFLSFVLAKITPNVIIPLFYKYQPIREASLRDKIFKLFKSCDVSLKDVYSINMSAKTKKANAFLCGMGKGRRVVLSDTLLNEFKENEIEVVVAHELGHLKHLDILKMLLVNSLVIVLGLFCVDHVLKKILAFTSLTRIDDIAFFPVFILSIMSFFFIVSPLLNYYSRVIEVAADRYSLEKTHNVNGFISVMLKLAAMNLSELNPTPITEFFFYDHPPIKKRVDFARAFQRIR